MAEEHTLCCRSCGKPKNLMELNERNGTLHCRECIQLYSLTHEDQFICAGCGMPFDNTEKHVIVGKPYCVNCADNRLDSIGGDPNA